MTSGKLKKYRTQIVTVKRPEVKPSTGAPQISNKYGAIPAQDGR